MNKTLENLEKWIDNFLEIKKLKYRDIDMVQRKIIHSKTTSQLAKSNFDNEVLRVAMKFHDIGRFKQYDLIKSYDDKIISHYELGKAIIEEELHKNNIEPSKELDMIKAVIMYHGGTKYISNNEKLDNESLELVEMSSRIDALDNGCRGVFLYIEDECLKDSKNYKKNNPNLDMKSVSNDVLNMFLDGKSFDKIKYCKTYADYILFAASLAIKSLTGPDKIIAKKIMNQKCGKYENALEGYEDLFKKFIDPNLFDICIECVYNFYNSL